MKKGQTLYHHGVPCVLMEITGEILKYRYVVRFDSGETKECCISELQESIRYGEHGHSAQSPTSKTFDNTAPEYWEIYSTTRVVYQEKLDGKYFYVIAYNKHGHEIGTGYNTVELLECIRDRQRRAIERATA